MPPWARRSGAGGAGARGWSRAASCAARGRPRAPASPAPGRRAQGGTARGHAQVHVPCIVLFKHESVGYCSMVKVVW